MTREPESAARWRTARRAALDHVLSLVTDAPWSESLVLRGSMAMLAWTGDEAREPADLDFVVVPRSVIPVDPLDPHPYVDRIEAVQQWPEAADGAARYEFWSDGEEEFETRGIRPVVPPDGLHWELAPHITDSIPPYDDLIELVRRQPEAAPGVLLDADKAHQDATWAYAYGENGTPGARLLIPWHAEGLPPGEVQLDFAQDEPLPQPPVWTLVPRGDGGKPSLVRSASRELSLAWKLVWLLADGAASGRPQCKDLYDAVLLADQTKLSPRLLRRVLSLTVDTGADDFCLDSDSVHLLEADWVEFRKDHPRIQGTAQEWFHRLISALAPMSEWTDTSPYADVSQ
jgi:hypothetical protein